jgi:hypothetical protein
MVVFRKKNEKAFTEIKNYYNDITLNNLAMISTLKEEIKNKDEKLERNEQLLGTVQARLLHSFFSCKETYLRRMKVT